jgi:hypothetical protein
MSVMTRRHAANRAPGDRNPGRARRSLLTGPQLFAAVQL